MPRLWVCTCAPAAMSWLARPMDWPYLCTTEPAGRSRTASLWPRGTSPGSTSTRVAVSSRAPPCSSPVATATSSSGPSRSAHSASGTTSRDPCSAITGRPSSWNVIRSPVVHRAVEEPVHREVRGGVLEGGRRRLIELDPQAGTLSRVQQTVDEGVARREHLQGRLVVHHELLDAEVVYRDVQVQRRCHTDRGDVRRAVDAGLDLVDRREVQDLAKPGDPTGMGRRRTHIVDQLFGDQGLVVEDAVEDLPDRQRGRGLRPHPAQALLVLRRGDVLEPEQVERCL